MAVAVLGGNNRTGSGSSSRGSEAGTRVRRQEDIGDVTDRVEFTLTYVQSIITEAGKLSDGARKIDDLKAARDLLQEVIDLSPSDHRLRFQAGILSGHLGDFKEAIAELRQAVLLNSGDNKRYLSMLGILSGRLNEISRGEVSKGILVIQEELALGHPEVAWSKALTMLNKSLEKDRSPDAWALHLARLASIGANQERSYVETLNNFRGKYPELRETPGLSIEGFDAGDFIDEGGGQPFRSRLREEGAIHFIGPVNDTAAKVTGYRRTAA
jgi:tetratricopeptide (TPR) repeat protein